MAYRKSFRRRGRASSYRKRSAGRKRSIMSRFTPMKQRLGMRK